VSKVEKEFLYLGRGNLFVKFLEIIEPVPISKEDDVWSCIYGEPFTVRSLYLFLYNRFIPTSLLGEYLSKAIAKVWKSWAPSKVIVFSWQALLGRIPTRVNLARRGVISGGESTSCSFCESFEESENHIFALCSFVWEVWSKVFKWFGVVSVLPHSMVSIFETFRAMCRIKKEGRRGTLMVWHAVLWTLWRTRNEKIFLGKILEVEEIIDKMKFVSWKWLLAKKDSAPCLFYE
jgi:hypothetical protein